MALSPHSVEYAPPREKAVGGFVWRELVARGAWGKVRRVERHAASCPLMVALADAAAAAAPERPASCACAPESCAVKIFYRDRLARKIRRGVEMLRDEFALVRTLDHPAVVRYLALDEHSRPHKMYLFMEYCPGGPVSSLAIDADAPFRGEECQPSHSGGDALYNNASPDPIGEALSPVARPEESSRVANHVGAPSHCAAPGRGAADAHAALRRIRRAMRELLAGLAYLHARGVAHHDVKCENVLLGADGAVRICDFGVAERFGGDGLCRVYYGTPAFQAPEVVADVSGSGYDGAAADVWSAGIVLFRLLSAGRIPYAGETVFLVMQAIATTEIALPEVRADPALRDLLARLLERDPKARISAADALEHPALRENRL